MIQAENPNLAFILAAGALALARAARRLPRRPALPCAGAARRHRAQLQGIDRQLPGRRRLEGRQPAGRDDARQLVGGLQRARAERSRRPAQHQQPEHQGVLSRTTWRPAPSSPRRARSTGRRITANPSWNRSQSSGNLQQFHAGQHRQDHQRSGTLPSTSPGRPTSGARSATKCAKRNMPRR